MKTSNTFTYKQSELPKFRPEIKAEIVEIDCQVADLILRCQGNYHELEYLSEVLDNCADNCELNLNSIRIIPDDSSNGSADTGISDLCSLSERSKAVVFSTGIASRVALDLLCQATGGSHKMLGEIITTLVRTIAKDVSPDEISQSLKQLADEFDSETSTYEIKIDRE
jgi:hypothetical protein